MLYLLRCDHKNTCSILVMGHLFNEYREEDPCPGLNNRHIEVEFTCTYSMPLGNSRDMPSFSIIAYIRKI